MNLVQKVHQFIQREHLLVPDDAVVVAVSGGADSVTLLDVLLALRDQYRLKIVAAHLNHMLRGEESDADEQFTKNLADARGITCRVGRVDTRAKAAERKHSVQETARELRYDFLCDVRDSLGFSKIATGHNADDNAETIILNLVRGAGVRGMTGIPPFREDLRVVRPLLGVTRTEIEAYAGERNLAYRTDSSNLTDHYTRNLLRHSVLPLLKQSVNPGVVETLGRTADLFRHLDDMLGQEAVRIQAGVVEHQDEVELVLSIPKLARHPQFMQEYCLALAARVFSARELEHSAVKSVAGLLGAETGSMVRFAGQGVAFRDRDRIVFRRAFPVRSFRYTVEPNKSYQFDHFSFSSAAADSLQQGQSGDVEYVDAERLGKTLVLRNWSDGDWFQPLGLHGKKKLSDFFIDAKVPLYEKRTIPVLESDGEIVWVCGKRIDERFKVRDETKRILRLEYSRLSE